MANKKNSARVKSTPKPKVAKRDEASDVFVTVAEAIRHLSDDQKRRVLKAVGLLYGVE